VRGSYSKPAGEKIVADEIENEDDEVNEPSLLSAGETLRQAREQKNLSIEDIAKTTRIPQRHLESVEAGDFDALPGRTYAIGFAKSFARAVDVSDATIGIQMREEMEEKGLTAYAPETSGYAPTNPTSIPPRYLALTAAGIGALVVIGYAIWRTLFLEPSPIDYATNDESATNETTVAATNNGSQQIAAPVPSATGTVILTATQTVWLKIYDEDGARLFESQMEPGDKYTVPADAKGPQILTGRPNGLTVTIDGKVVAPLGTAERTISDVGISAAALLARGEINSPTGNQPSVSQNADQ
jgi:cytoskeletal protein RodZ